MSFISITEMGYHYQRFKAYLFIYLFNIYFSMITQVIDYLYASFSSLFFFFYCR